jgi:ABC-2 type transport system ATP-binding protein
MENIVETKKLTKAYGGFTAVDELDMEVEKGEVFGFLGPNGAGKTTTILMLMGLSVPTKGTAIVGGHDIVEESREVRRVASILPEYSSLYGELTAWENLDYIGKLNDQPKEERENRVAEMLETVGMAKWADNKLESFSRGMKQRLGIASTLMKDPQVVFLDEPTIGLDPVATREVRELIMRLNRERNLTVVMTSHLLHEIQLTCSKIGIINRGKLILLESMENLNKIMSGGGDRSVEFRLTEAPPDLVNDLEAVRGVKSVTQENGRLHVYGSVDSDLEVSKTIVSHGAIILMMKPREYTLEEIFMKYYQQEVAR